MWPDPPNHMAVLLFCRLLIGSAYDYSLLGFLAMTKPLEEMSREELGMLFPIIISDHNPDWAHLYFAEKEFIVENVGEADVVRIQHYGSTSIPGIPAKPTVDILLEVRDGIDTDGLVAKFRRMGYHFSPQPDNPPPHLMFMKGYTLHGFEGQAFHVHVRYRGDWDELYFRDYLILHPEIAEKYGELKLQLKESYEHDREAYTQSKTEFIKVVTAEARKYLGIRY
jgi:GrpB-like predicted nucleotidyltransferase (UPF0157 family)